MVKEDTMKQLNYPSMITTPDKVESRIGTLQFTDPHAEPGSRSICSMTTWTSRKPYS